MLEMYRGMINSPETTITNDINAEDTIIYVLDETKVPEELPNLMTLGTGTSAETVKVLEVNGNALTVERGFQGVPRNWNAGSVIARNFTEYDYNALVENVKTLKENTDTNADDILDLMSYVGDLENLDTTEKANLVLALNETYQELAAHKADYDTFKQDIHAEFDSHKNENATGAHKAKNIAIDDAEGHFTATDVEGALNELFTSVSDGKTLIATAITDKGIPASGSDTFSQLANKIEQIETEVEGYKVGDILNPSKYLIAPEVWQFTGHTSRVNAVAVDNNGNIYSGSDDSTVRKISPDGNEIWQFTGHTNFVYAVAVDNNGNVYSGSNDRTVRKISPDGNEIWQFTGHGSTVYAVAVDNNGNIYSGSYDQTVRKISPDGNQIWQFTGHTWTVIAVAVDNNGNVYSGSGDRTVRKISPDGNQIWQFTGHTDAVRAVAVDNYGNVYSGSDDRTARKISPDGNEVWKFTGHTATVYAVAVDNNGNIYSGSYDQTVRKISPDGNQIWQFTGHTDAVRAVAVDNYGNVYSGSDDRTARKIIDGIKIIA